MNSLLKAGFKRTLLPLLARREFQFVFERLHRFSLVGMNCGPVGEVQTSGELTLARRILRQAPPDAVVIDVGANVGEFAIICSRYAPSTARIFALEPSPSIYDLLCQNLVRANLGSRVTAVPVGLSDAARSATLFVTTGFEGNSSLRSRHQDHLTRAADVQTIALTTLDAFCAERILNHVHFLKVDIEGEEYACLAGARDLMDAGAIDYIQFEFGGCNIQSRIFLKDFWDLLSPRYRLFRLAQNGVTQLPRYHELLEVFTTTNFLAVRHGIRTP